MRFLAYFDYLGFADFIERNDREYQERIINNNFRDIENALSKGKTVPGGFGVVHADLSNSHLHCISFSDTVIFWTKDDSLEALKELLEVAYLYNWTCIDYFFPARGSIVWGDIFDRKFEHQSNNGGTYRVNSVFGKGLVTAHSKAESQDWAGSVIDDSVLQFLNQKALRSEDVLKPFAKKYLVPYKKKIENQTEEWVLNLIVDHGNLNETAFQNMKKNITENFGKHNKRTEFDFVQRKIQNTINFLESYK